MSNVPTHPKFITNNTFQLAQMGLTKQERAPFSSTPSSLLISHLGFAKRHYYILERTLQIRICSPKAAKQQEIPVCKNELLEL